jgi:hypothetical protein
MKMITVRSMIGYLKCARTDNSLQFLWDFFACFSVGPSLSSSFIIWTWFPRLSTQYILRIYQTCHPMISSVSSSGENNNSVCNSQILTWLKLGPGYQLYEQTGLTPAHDSCLTRTMNIINSLHFYGRYNK